MVIGTRVMWAVKKTETRKELTTYKNKDDVDYDVLKYDSKKKKKPHKKGLRIGLRVRPKIEN